MARKIHIATIKSSELKVRKKSLRSTQVQKSDKEYDRKKLIVGISMNKDGGNHGFSKN